MNIAFYAPMKPPDHPVPSGDRTMARLLVAALRHAGHAVEIVSTLRSHMQAPDPDRCGAVRCAAAHEIAGIAARWQDVGAPDLWFTYHNYYKAPDLLGPDLTRLFGLPYGVAEASHAPRRAADWGLWASLADAATRRADLHVCFTDRDWSGIAPLLAADAAVLDLPPFVDARAWPEPARRPTGADPPTLLALAMMRPGDKLRSYRFLAASLAQLLHLDWRLHVVGDGEARADVEDSFAAVPPERVRFRGRRDGAALAAEMSRADIFVWPGFGEAFGLAYLEAQLSGLPVVALDTAGVDAVVRHGETGLLVAPPEPEAYAAAVGRLVADPDLRHRMSAAATRWVRRDRTLMGAALRLDEALQEIRLRDRSWLTA